MRESEKESIGGCELLAPSVSATHQSNAETYKICGLHELGVHLGWMNVTGVKG